MTKNNSNPGEKTFSLKHTEMNLIGNCNQRHNAELLDLFSYIAIERLNYNVTKQTQFRTDAEGNLYITEVEEPQEEVAVS
jgi:hypothetical protein